MILLVGGTSETGPLARSLLDAGYSVLVSLATEVELDVPIHPALELRRGRLDCLGFSSLFRAFGISAVVDASHPFATELHREISQACAIAGTQRIRFERPKSPLPSWVEEVPDHEQAAQRAVVPCLPILLTTGSRFLTPYVVAARLADIPLFARVLPGEESVQACLRQGMSMSCIEWARGPFTVQQTRGLLQRWNIGVMVLKDGGPASGMAHRLEAAHLAGIRALVVRRPPSPSGCVDSFGQVLDRLQRIKLDPLETDSVIRHRCAEKSIRRRREES